MSQRDAKPVRAWSMTVRVPVEPVEAAMEADASDAASRTSALGVRGPLFGVAAQRREDGLRWRVTVEVTHGCPQQARDDLNSLLWFRAKDDARDRAERRALLAAVARLESERVDELTVAGTRYRVVRADEYAGLDAHGDIERPRPTDAQHGTLDWDRATSRPKIDEGLVLDPDAPVTPAQAAERLALRSLAYTGSRFPEHVRADAHRALHTHPDVLLLPATFAVVQRSDRSWTPGSALHATAHDARKTLDFSLTWWEPRNRGLIPMDAGMAADARTLTAEGADPAAAELAVYAEAADRLRAGHLDEIEVLGTVHRIGRIRRLLRWGPDGPEGPRPSDVDSHDPGPIHPALDEDGTVHFADEGADE
ncbi:DUF5954 family protein [Streptomyces sp. NPDC058308]|uniref:DUF5954 family protein n=1 Tax=Streptomyces sp. NPDC058308 TaxID=3346440 RepID=UPI0036E36123